MKLDYATLISPYPLSLERIGHVKPPVLKEIFGLKITYQIYSMYLSLLLMTPDNYYEYFANDSSDWYLSLSEEKRLRINMFNIICIDEKLRSSFLDMLNFFMVERIEWDNKNKVFLSYENSYDNKSSPSGLIHKNIFAELCDVILQFCSVNRSDSDVDISKVENKRALEILEKFQKGRKTTSKKSERNTGLELPNLVSSVAVKSNSVNYTNIWDMTVYQLYDQFKREQMNIYFDIQTMNVAAYGNKEKSFKGDEWYKNIE